MTHASSSVLLLFDGHRFSNILDHTIAYTPARNSINLFCVCQEDHDIERERKIVEFPNESINMADITKLFFFCDF